MKTGNFHYMYFFFPVDQERNWFFSAIVFHNTDLSKEDREKVTLFPQFIITCHRHKVLITSVHRS